MDTLSAEAAKFARARAQEGSSDGALAAARRAAAEEFVRSSVAVDMVDIARQMRRSSSGRAELERMAADLAEHDQQEPMKALAVLAGKALSIFSPPRCQPLTRSSSLATACPSSKKGDACDVPADLRGAAGSGGAGI